MNDLTRRRPQRRRSRESSPDPTMAAVVSPQVLWRSARGRCRFQSKGSKSLCRFFPLKSFSWVDLDFRLLSPQVTGWDLLSEPPLVVARGRWSNWGPTGPKLFGRWNVFFLRCTIIQRIVPFHEKKTQQRILGLESVCLGKLFSLSFGQQTKNHETPHRYGQSTWV